MRSHQICFKSDWESVCVCVCVFPLFPLLRFLLCTTKLMNSRLYVIKHDVYWSGMIYSRVGSLDFNFFNFILFSAAWPHFAF